MMKRAKTLLSLLLCLSLLLSLQAAVFADGAATLEEKVAEICAECRAQGFETEYEIALWLHDWLTANADYDTSYTHHEPEGVLLLGTGVCESYAQAYRLLLNEMGIENTTLAGEAGDERESHIWNVVRLDGVWCQIDVTWDDPKGGGAENHNYFGLTDALMARDHFWDPADATQVCDSLDNYYPQRMGAIVYTTAEELYARLSAAAEQQQTVFELAYVGTDAAHEAVDDFLAWYRDYAHLYGLGGFEAGYTSYGCRISSIRYTEPWEPSETHLDEPIDAPAFSLSGPDGSYSLDMYSGNGFALVFLPGYGESYTSYVIDSLYDQIEALREVGVELLFCLSGASALSDYLPANSDWPGLRYCYWNSSALFAFYSALHPGATGYSYPLYAVVNGESQIVCAADGQNFDATEFLSEAFAVGSAQPLPVPSNAEAPHQNTSGRSIADLPAGDLRTALSDACSESEGVFLVIDSSFNSGYGGTLVENWERDYRLYELAGLSLVACIGGVSDTKTESYPHVTFVPYSESIFWSLHGLFSGDDACPFSCCYLDSQGNFLNYVNGSMLDTTAYLNEWFNDMPYEAVLPAGLTTLEGYAFDNTALHSLDLSGTSLSAIPANAFAGCAKLEIVRIPASVTEIDTSAFADSADYVIVCPFNSAAAAFAYTNGLPLLCP